MNRSRVYQNETYLAALFLTLLAVNADAQTILRTRAITATPEATAPARNTAAQTVTEPNAADLAPLVPDRPQQAPLSAPPQPVRRAASDDSGDDMQAMQAMAPFLQSLFGGGPGLGGSGSGGRQTGGKYEARFGESVTGLDACGVVPPHVLKSKEKAMRFRQSCGPAISPKQNDGDEKIVINDYTGNGPEMMYIFNLEGECLRRTSITWGQGKTGDPYTASLSCSQGGRNRTPAGFHITSYHDGRDYKNYNSLQLIGLQGQGSGGREILIHGAQAPGTATSLGCVGVGPIREVMEMVGYGSLVYNDFGDKPTAPDCQKDAGRDETTCQKDPEDVSGGTPPPPPPGADAVS